jgi:hypothetical protein
MASGLEALHYVIEPDPQIPFVQGQLYARSPEPIRLGFSKVEDHFLFVDWDQALSGQFEHLQDAYELFSVFVNQGFRTPHLLRVRIPNIAVVAVSSGQYTAEVIASVQNAYLTPWYGGQTGLLVLWDPTDNALVYRKPSNFREYGSLPVNHSGEVLEKVCLQ